MTSIPETSVERKRTQNRLAQRKHRDKLKQRIEELEDELKTVKTNPTSLQSEHSSSSILHQIPSHTQALEDLTQATHAHPPGLNSFGQHELSDGLLLSGDIISPFKTTTPVWGMGQRGSLNETPATFPLFPATPFSPSPPMDHHTVGQNNIDHIMTVSPMPAMVPGVDIDVQPLPPSTILGHSDMATISPEPQPNIIPYTTQSLEQAFTRDLSILPQRSVEPTISYLPTPPRAGQSDASSEAYASIDVGSKALEDASMDKRISFVLDCVRQAGFESFDELVAEYYTSDELDIMSPAFEAQRASRSRGLRRVLEIIREKSATWSEYERMGYKDETFRAAETLYNNELLCAASRSDVKREVEKGLLGGDADEDSTASALADGRRAAKKKLQDQVPNLWNLIYGLKNGSETGQTGSQELLSMLLSLAQDRAGKSSKPD